MFSRYKKSSVKDASALAGTPAARAPEAPQAEVPKLVQRKPTPTVEAKAAPQDKEQKRRERMFEIKLEMHRALLENLNLAALDQASERELREEIERGKPDAKTSEPESGQRPSSNRERDQSI